MPMKERLPDYVFNNLPKPSLYRQFKFLAIVATAAFLIGHWLFVSYYYLLFTAEELCVQVKPLLPSQGYSLWDTFNSLVDEPAFGARAASWLGEAVQIPTE